MDLGLARDTPRREYEQTLARRSRCSTGPSDPGGRHTGGHHTLTAATVPDTAAPRAGVGLGQHETRERRGAERTGRVRTEGATR